MAVKTSAIAATAQATCFNKAPVSLLAATFILLTHPCYCCHRRSAGTDDRFA
jgi:hypothetical protein